MDTKDDDSEKATPSKFSYVTCIMYNQAVQFQGFYLHVETFQLLSRDTARWKMAPIKSSNSTEDTISPD